MTGWRWEEAEALTVPRFRALAGAWKRWGPLAPYIQSPDPAPAAGSVPAGPAPTGDPNTDPLGFLMRHPEVLHG